MQNLLLGTRGAVLHHSAETASNRDGQHIWYIGISECGRGTKAIITISPYWVGSAVLLISLM